MKPGFVYLMASRLNGTIYLGVTSNLIQRAYQHRNGLADGFSRQHGCKLLVWYESHEELEEARRREFQLKKWKREWKLRLIERENRLARPVSHALGMKALGSCLHRSTAD